MLFDLKILKSTLEQIEVEKKIPQSAIIEAIEQSLAAAYKRDYGKRGQIIRAKFNLETGDVDFSQIKIVVDETTVRPALTAEEIENGVVEDIAEGEDVLPRFDEEKHLYIADAKRMKNDVVLGEELVFPLEQPDKEFGRIAAQTAKQVIMQRLREAEKVKKDSKIIAFIIWLARISAFTYLESLRILEKLLRVFLFKLLKLFVSSQPIMR
jgi:N utilization substance protein A